MYSTPLNNLPVEEREGNADESGFAVFGKGILIFKL